MMFCGIEAAILVAVEGGQLFLDMRGQALWMRSSWARSVWRGGLRMGTGGGEGEREAGGEEECSAGGETLDRSRRPREA
jgi:hypothetical protein